MVKTDAADHVTRHFLDDGPMTVSAQLPVTEHVVGVLHRQLETAWRFAERDLLLRHDLRIPEDAHEGLRIRKLRHA